MTDNRFIRKFDVEKYEPEKCILDKRRSVMDKIKYMFNRTIRMFEYKGLPDTIPSIELERMLQEIGYVGICIPKHSPKNITLFNASEPVSTTKDGEKLPFAFYGSLGGERDAYYNPTIFTVSNPALNFSDNYTIGSDCVIIRNDTHMLGLYPLFERFAYQMAESEITLRSALILGRAHRAIIADSERAYESTKAYLSSLERGELAAIMDTPLVGGTRIEDMSDKTQAMQDILSVGQYFKAAWYNELGLNSSFSIDREYISEEEISANTDILLPLVDDMLESRRAGIDAVNAMFNLSITVDKASAWKLKEREANANEESSNDSGSDGELEQRKRDIRED